MVKAEINWIPVTKKTPKNIDFDVKLLTVRWWNNVSSGEHVTFGFYFDGKWKSSYKENIDIEFFSPYMNCVVTHWAETPQTPISTHSILKKLLPQQKWDEYNATLLRNRH